jgi:hypothetical protein
LKEAGRLLDVLDHKEQAIEFYRRYIEMAPSEAEDTQIVLLWFKQVLDSLPSSPVSPEPKLPPAPFTKPIHVIVPLALPPIVVSPIRASLLVLAPLPSDLPHQGPVSIRLGRLGIASGVLSGMALIFSAVALGFDGRRDFGSCQSFTAMDCQPHTLSAAVTGFILTGVGLTATITLSELSTRY